MINASCHCGNVQVQLPILTESATECNCSICFRYGARWGYFKQKEVSVSIGELGVNAYSHGDKMIAFVWCKNCGCLTHYTSTKADPDARFAINYRMVDPALTEQLMIRHFDGADSWTFLD